MTLPANPVAPSSGQHLLYLDVLRGIAILLVLIHHHCTTLPLVQSIGWIGVDLFFVLSGFLVSGLLFSEFQRHGTINPCNFIMRRGLKILPAFFCCIGITLILEALKAFLAQTPFPLSTRSILSEIFFFQSYCGGLFVHTWSLTVEMHFYVLVLVCVYFGLTRCPGFFKKYFPAFVCMIMAACLCMRVGKNLHAPFEFWSMFTPTHLRIDSLWLGTLVAYFYYFKQDSFMHFIDKHGRWMFLFTCCGLTAFTMFRHYSFFTYTSGFILLSTSFGCLLSLALTKNINSVTARRHPLSCIVSALRGLGIHSYSIYLWHIFVIKYVLGFIVHREIIQSVPAVLENIIYLILCCTLGIVMSKLVEMPVLKIRDKLLPRV